VQAPTGDPCTDAKVRTAGIVKCGISESSNCGCNSLLNIGDWPMVRLRGSHRRLATTSPARSWAPIKQKALNIKAKRKARILHWHPGECKRLRCPMHGPVRDPAWPISRACSHWKPRHPHRVSGPGPAIIRPPGSVPAICRYAGKRSTG